MSKKVCLISDHHLCINPRLWKEAFLYEKLGFEVVILTKCQSDDLRKRDMELLKGHNIRYEFFLNLIPGEINPVMRFYYRLRKRIASELQRRLKAGGAWAINHAPDLLYKAALKEHAFIYSAHLECGFYVGRELVKAGRKVSFDFEDWYSRDYLTADRATGLLRQLEQFALTHGVFCTAASGSMADALRQAYGSQLPITAVYNSFPDEELQTLPNIVSDPGLPFRFVWTSRTVGPGRGLETLMEALTMVSSPVELHIIGQCAPGYEEQVKNSFPSSLGHQLLFHHFIKHSDLLPTLAGFDAGLAIERYEPDSRNTTITNKILQYIQAGIKVLATDTLGQKEVAAFFPDAILLVEQDAPMQWKAAIEQMIASRDAVDKNAQLAIFHQTFSWKRQEEKLTQLINKSV